MYRSKEKTINLVKRLFLLVLLLFVLNLSAQNSIDRSLITKAKQIFIEFDLIDNLELISTDKGQIEVFSKNDFGGSSNFKLEEKKGIIYIENIIDIPLNNDLLDKECTVQPNFPSFIITIPKDREVDIFIKEGNFFTQEFEGNINLKIEKGIVNVNGLKGKMQIKIDIGNVYCNLNNTKVDISTKLGFIRTTTSFNFIINDDQHKKGVVDRPENELYIKAIKANIFLKN